MTETNNNAESYLNVSSLLAASRAYSDAEVHVRKALELNPEYGDAWSLLGSIFSHTRRFPEAEDAYRHAIELLPAAPEIALGLANSLSAQGKAEQALPHFQQVKQHYENQTVEQPKCDAAHAILGYIYLIEGNWLQAEKSLRAALRAHPNDIDSQLRLSEALLHQCKAKEALVFCEKILLTAPGNIKAILKAAEALDVLGKPHEALQRANQILETKPDNYDAIILGANMLEKMGKPREGYERLLPLAERSDISNTNIALTFSNISQHLGITNVAIKMLERILDKEATIKKDERCMLHFSLGDLLDRQGSYDLAFWHYQSANQLKRGSFCTKDNNELFNAIINTFTHDGLAKLPQSSIHTELPIFIVGMPRSGTTLVEQILSSHPNVCGAGELPDIERIAKSLGQHLNGFMEYPLYIPDITKRITNAAAMEYLRTLESLAGGAVRVIDKMPYNFMYLGLIQLLFPNAKIIHCQRNPLDTCLSCYFKNFLGSHPYAYNLEHLGIYYQNYMRLMEHWRSNLEIPIYNILYEDLINDQNSVSRQLVKFCELEWDDNCLRFYENERFAATSSYNQVRQPIYTTSVERWRNYEHHLKPLLCSLDQSRMPDG